MDFEGYWQENKRFVARTAGGVFLFFAGIMTVDALYAEDIARESSRVRRLERDLEQPMYAASDRDGASSKNEELRAVVDQLSGVVRFVARPELRLDPNRGSAANQYLRALANARERILLRAGRSNVSIEPGLGMPKLSPTAEDEIERYLEALDVVEIVSGLAIDALVRRIDDIQVRLDPGLSSRSGLDRIERTRVSFSILGESRALTDLLSATQRPEDGRILHVDSAEVLSARGREGELRLDLTLLITRLQLEEPVGQDA